VGPIVSKNQSVRPLVVIGKAPSVRRQEEDGAMAVMCQAHAAVVWLDPWHALVARRDHGVAAIVDVDRGADPEEEFLDRVAELTDDCDRMMILGPANDRLIREREVVVQHHRELVALDIEARAAASPSELFDRLRLLEGDAATLPAG
jgi:hypothetical protein